MGSTSYTVRVRACVHFGNSAIARLAALGRGGAGRGEQVMAGGAGGAACVLAHKMHRRKICDCVGRLVWQTAFLLIHRAGHGGALWGGGGAVVGRWGRVGCSAV